MEGLMKKRVAVSVNSDDSSLPSPRSSCCKNRALTIASSPLPLPTDNPEFFLNSKELRGLRTTDLPSHVRKEHRNHMRFERARRKRYALREKRIRKDDASDTFSSSFESGDDGERKERTPSEEKKRSQKKLRFAARAVAFGGSSDAVHPKIAARGGLNSSQASVSYSNLGLSQVSISVPSTRRRRRCRVSESSADSLPFVDTAEYQRASERLQRKEARDLVVMMVPRRCVPAVETLLKELVANETK